MSCDEVTVLKGIPPTDRPAKHADRVLGYLREGEKTSTESFKTRNRGIGREIRVGGLEMMVVRIQSSRWDLGKAQSEEGSKHSDKRWLQTNFKDLFLIAPVHSSVFLPSRVHLEMRKAADGRIAGFD